jgi:dihydroorotase
MQLDLPRWYDLHAHFRQGPNMASYLHAHRAMGCAGILAMPNTLPPVSSVNGHETEHSWSISGYRDRLLAAGADCFDQLIIPLYITRDTTPQMIELGAASGLLRAAKYYPPHGTTNAEHGLPMTELLGGDVLAALAENAVTLCIHGEEHALSGERYFDASCNAESLFYRETMPRLLDCHPSLCLTCEHITTAEAVAFVESAPADQVGATITPQHLLFTIGHLIKGLRHHLYCLPAVKFVADREALRNAVSTPGQRQFFAGTDSAPHTTKATSCGCAAGCFTGGCAPQLYAMAFEEAGVDLSSAPGQSLFTHFLCTNGPDHYGFATSKEVFSLIRTPSTTRPLEAPDGVVTPLPLGLAMDLTWSLAS